MTAIGRLIIMMALLSAPLLSSLAWASRPLLILSTQFAPLEETRLIRELVLPDFHRNATLFQPVYKRDVFLTLARTTQKKAPALVMGLYGDLVALDKEIGLVPLEGAAYSGTQQNSGREPNAASDNTIIKRSIPWLRSTHVMVAHRRALPYLPEGSDLDNLTYRQLKQWSEAIHKKSGGPRLGLPAGQDGSVHHFIFGYLYPSFTAGAEKSLNSPDAVAMWEYFRSLWRSVNTRSLVFDTIQKPLLSGEVWIGWERTNNLYAVLENKPDDFVVFPVPKGPKGRGFLSLTSYIGIPSNTPDLEASYALLNFLDSKEIREFTASSVNFYSVSKEGEIFTQAHDLGPIEQAIVKQNSAADGVPVNMPSNLGNLHGLFNLAYRLLFTRIVLREMEIKEMLDWQHERLDSIGLLHQKSGNLQ